VPLGTGAGRFRFAPRDAFPIDDVPAEPPRIGVVAAGSVEACAAGVATEVARLLAGRTFVRDPRAGTPRPATPGDIAILFRSREGHQEYERALTAGGIPAYVYKGLGFFDADETKDLVAIVEYLARPDSDTAAAALLRSRLIRLSDDGLRRLAPRLAAALRGGAREGETELDDEDRRVLEQARRTVAAWLPLVDCLPPAEVIDRVLDDAAYSYELRGPRRPQARENVKKMRALMRKIQNAGYATMLDLAGHLRTLSAGDESNAVIDAIDAVNLMTVHAAKGLEFPIVFLVNLSRGTGGGRDPIRVSRGRGTVSVSIGDFVSENDDQVPQRETEETKRLLYVAVTRARDRLYFSSPLTDGRFEPRRGGLGSVLPEGFTPLLTEQAEGCARIAEWRGPSGRVHQIAVCPHDGPPPVAGQASGAREERVSSPDMFERLESGGVPRVAVTTLASADGDDAARWSPSTGAPATAESQAALGLLVHRVFQSLGPGDSTPPLDELRERALALLDAGDLAVPDQSDKLVERAIETVQAICADARVGALRREGEWHHEVPFSMRQGAAVVRGVIDSLVAHQNGVTVIEIKTGGPRPEHAKQLDVYRTAATALFPGRPVDAVLVYGHRDA
jgi:ATP-dependent helicase/nuclease subunit A